MTRFADAWLLWIVAPLYLAFAATWLLLRYLEAKRRVRLSPALGFSRLRSLSGGPRALGPYLRRAIEALRLVTLGLLLVAFLRPQASNTKQPITSDGIAIVFAIDASGSMRALDLDTDKPIAMRKTRLGVVQEVVAEFIDKRGADELGIVVFGAEAFLQCPLTLDHGMTHTLLGNLSIGMAGDATAIGSGLGVATKRLEHSRAKSKVVILLTDGVSNAGPLSPKKAAEVAKSMGIRVYTIGAGSSGQAPYIVDHPLFGKRVEYQDVSIDEPTLEEIAAVTGGAYFRAEDKRGLEAIYERIDTLEKSAIESTVYADYHERFSPWVLAAMLLLFAEVLLLNTRFAKVP